MPSKRLILLLSFLKVIQIEVALTTAPAYCLEQFLGCSTDEDNSNGLEISEVELEFKEDRICWA